MGQKGRFGALIRGSQMSKGVCVGGEGGSEGVLGQRVRRFCLIFRLFLA